MKRERWETRERGGAQREKLGRKSSRKRSEREEKDRIYISKNENEEKGGEEARVEGGVLRRVERREN